MVYKTKFKIKDFYETLSLNQAGIIVASSNGNSTGRIGNSWRRLFRLWKSGGSMSRMYIEMKIRESF